jgi:putative addiction module component (TIGR02574 family)
MTMSVRDILTELPKLTPEERREVVDKVLELDGADWDDGELTEAEKSILDERLADYERNPAAGSPWEEVKARIRARLQGQ